MSDSDIEVFRNFASTAIKNSHAVIKQAWVLLFTGGTFALINSFDRYCECAKIFPNDGAACRGYLQPDYVKDLWNIATIFTCFVVYILTFYRFYVGNIRVFDMRYSEFIEFSDSVYKSGATESADKKSRDNHYEAIFRYVEKNSRGENLALIAKTFLIIALTNQTIVPKAFLLIYICLLAVDVAWTVFNTRPSPFFMNSFRSYFKKYEDRLEKETSLFKVFPSTSMIVWKYNNIFFLTLLSINWTALIYMDGGRLYSVTMIKDMPILFVSSFLMFCNCIFDLRLTWRFYNPSFRAAHAIILESQKSEPAK